METGLELDFGDGRYLFALKFPQIIELERKCGRKLPDGTILSKSVFQIFEEMTDGIGVGQDDGQARFVGGGQANALDISETIRLGLIGGNSGLVDGDAIEVGPLTASSLVKSYVHERPLSEGIAVAWAILNAAITGVQLKKKPESEKAQPLKDSKRGQ